MSRYCVIGSGISGATIADLLSKKHSIDLFDKKEFKGQNTLILLCGSNIDYHSWNKLIYS